MSLRPAVRLGQLGVDSAARIALRIDINRMLLLVLLYMSTVQNQAFWKLVFARLPQPWGTAEVGLLISLFVALNSLLLLAILPWTHRATIKPAVSLFLLIGSACSYFMDRFGVIIDQAMIVNAIQTDAREAGELIGPAMISHIVLFGAVPALALTRIELAYCRGWTELWRRIALLASITVVLLGCVAANYKTVSLWARENRAVRTLVNPTFPIYSAYRQARDLLASPEGPVLPIATDAVRQPAANGLHRVVILVVGETARRANFQLAGYTRDTTPEMARIDGVVSFADVTSCGTATAVSVPCMFSRLGRTEFSRSKARKEENVLDVIQRTGVSVLWRDNNSDCKGVCLRVPTEDRPYLQTANGCADSGCHDEILLQGLDERLQSTDGDALIVLHLLGSHGPSYYKRYPDAFRRFTPDCAQDEVQKCSRESIVNAYDNTIVYTDHVLSRVVAQLQQHQDRIDPTLIYLSDHGESLGERGVYLHGLPYAMAPAEQIEVPLLLWSPRRNQSCIEQKKDRAFSHDNLFHTLLGLYRIETVEYRRDADILDGCS